MQNTNYFVVFFAVTLIRIEPTVTGKSIFMVAACATRHAVFATPAHLMPVFVLA